MREKLPFAIEKIAKEIISSNHHHLGEVKIEEGIYQELSRLLQPYFFYSQALFLIVFNKGTHFGVTPAKEEETVIQNLKNSQGNHH